jgi:iron complex outermembrane recepter protein
MRNNTRLRTGRWPRAAALGLGLTVFATNAAAHGQSTTMPPLKHLSLEELGSIVVTSVSKAPEAVWQTAAAIYVLTHDDILRSGATSIPDALRLVPGVDVARIDTSRNWVVGIRGFGDQFSKSVLVLIDGRTAYTPLWAGVHWPIQDTLLEDVDRIEVIRGPGGTIWGANAENGVVNIITKSSRNTHGVYATAAAGNVDEAIGGVRFGGGNGAGLDYRVYGKGIKRGPQYHTDGREFDTWGMGQAGFRLDWQRQRDQVTFQGDAYSAQLGESVRVSTFAPPATFLADDPVDLNGANLSAKWHRSIEQGSDLTVQAYVDHTYRLGTDFGERRTTIDVDAIHHWQASRRHDLIWGGGARTSPSLVIQTYSFSNFEPREQTLNLFSAFAQDSVTIVPKRLTAAAGIKFEHNSYTGLETQPSGRVTWTLSDRQTLWGGITRAVRIPSRVDEDITVLGLARAVPAPPVYGEIAGNRSLDAERVIGSEVGYRTLVTPALYIDVTGFDNHYDNLVDLGSPTVRGQTTEGLAYTAFVFPWINGVKGVTKGIEVAPDWQPSTAVRFRGSYSYLDIDLESKGGNAQQTLVPALEASPHHRVTLQARFDVRPGFQIDPVYRFVSERGPTGIPGYHTADVRLAIPAGAHFVVSLVGQNLLQSHHPEWARDPGPTVEIRRSGYVRISAHW